jgi:hypothetical protein
MDVVPPNAGSLATGTTWSTQYPSAFISAAQQALNDGQSSAFPNRQVKTLANFTSPSAPGVTTVRVTFSQFAYSINGASQGIGGLLGLGAADIAVGSPGASFSGIFVLREGLYQDPEFAVLDPSTTMASLAGAPNVTQTWCLQQFTGLPQALLQTVPPGGAEATLLGLCTQP